MASTAAIADDAVQFGSADMRTVFFIEASTMIARASARLDSMYFKLKWPLGIDYVLLRGARVDGRSVQEKIKE